MNKYITVSELTKSIKQTLEEGFSSIKLEGEISNFKAHSSGHWYFTLKDENAQISCTMWRGLNQYVFFTPQHGMKVNVQGKITVYPPRGSYQLDVRSMKPAGVGDLQAAFEELKRKLSEEGLFDTEHKKSISRFSQKIGLVTAGTGAAFRDMISVAKRRFPLVELVLRSAKVQGEDAAKDVAKAIEELNERNDIDVIIVSRGGGSLEDLWAFNEEITARSIFNSNIPIISGVGHEVDFTIADYVADLRAPTPSAAMELATPDQNEIIAFIKEFSYNSRNNINSLINKRKEYINYLLKSYGFNNPQSLVKNREQQIDNLIYRLNNNIGNIIKEKSNLLNLLTKSIEANDIKNTLKKGFAIVRQDNEIVNRAEKFDSDKKTKIEFYDKEIEIN